MSLFIRQATWADAPAIYAGEQDTAAIPGRLVSLPDELKLENYQHSIQALQQNGRYLVAEMNGQIVGHACLFPMSLQAISHVFRLNIVVYPGFTRQGIGTALLTALLAWAKTDPRVKKIELQVRATNQAAQQLYLKHGFTEEGRLRRRIRLPDNTYVDDMMMAWFPDPVQ